MAFALEVLPEVASDEEGQGYYAQTYGASRLKRAYRITRDAAALLRPDEQGRPGVVNRLNDSVQVEGQVAGGYGLSATELFFTRLYDARAGGTPAPVLTEIFSVSTKRRCFSRPDWLSCGKPGRHNPAKSIRTLAATVRPATVHARILPCRFCGEGHGCFWIDAKSSTGYAAVSFDEENIPDRSIRLTQLLPSRNGQSVQLTPCPEENWFAANC